MTTSNVHPVENLLAEGKLYIGDGYRAKNVELGDRGIPFARAGNVQEGLSFSEADRFPVENLERVGRKVSQPGDVVFTSKGTVGRFAYVREDTERFVYSPQLCFWRSHDPEFLYPRFLYFWMHSQEFMGQVNAVRSQTDMADYVSLRNQRKFAITVPSIQVQGRIAEVLSAYDDLIENNNRRMELLEEAIHLLFREWFVYLRFPGHERVEVEDGVPEGWERVSFADLAEFRNGYAFKPGHRGEEGKPIVKIPELREGVTQKTPRNSGHGIPRRHHFDDGTLLFSWSGSFVVRVWNGGPAMLNQHLFQVLPNGRCTVAFLEPALRHSIDRFRSLSVGTTMKHIRRSALQEVDVLLPEPSLLRAFEELAARMLRQRAALERTNRKLREARDLLLPRLMDGRIPV